MSPIRPKDRWEHSAFSKRTQFPLVFPLSPNYAGNILNRYLTGLMSFHSHVWSKRCKLGTCEFGSCIANHELSARLRFSEQTYLANRRQTSCIIMFREIFLAPLKIVDFTGFWKSINLNGIRAHAWTKKRSFSPCMHLRGHFEPHRARMLFSFETILHDSKRLSYDS